MANASHGAAPSALGYQHQTWWALLELLRTGASRPDATITLELYDDVAWEEGGSPSELLQLKHHQTQQRSLTDHSPDLWATLRGWMDTANPTDPNGPMLVLVTTQTASEGSAVAALRSGTRDDAHALNGLLAVAIDAQSGVTGKARDQFLALGPAGQRTLLSRVRLVDGADHIEDIAAGVRSQLWWALPTGHEELFLALVWRWWDAQALAMLRGELSGVEVGAAGAAITEIRDRFTRDDLPTFIELADVDPRAVAADHATALFVKQMQWVAFPPRNLEGAIVDFYRASTQTIRCLDEGLMSLGEVDRVQNELEDEWARAFEWMAMAVRPDAEEDAKRDAGRRLLRDLADCTNVTVRPRYNESYFIRGQRHVLADEGRIGWHLDYEGRIADLRADQP